MSAFCVFLVEKCHGQQEDGDLLHGGDEECGQRGKLSKIQKTLALICLQKVYEQNNPTVRIHSAKTWHSDALP